MPKQYKLAILIGRFQPIHNGHFKNIHLAMELADEMAIIIGSSNQPRTIKNPFTGRERTEMIGDSYNDLNLKTPYRITITEIQDYSYNDNLWIKSIQNNIRSFYKNIKDEEIIILGHEKDQSSWYLRAFPTWKFIDVVMEKVDGLLIDATKIRELYFEGHMEYIKGAVPPKVYAFFESFSKTEDFKNLVEEYNFIKSYKKSWEAAPYPPTFFTVDSVVIQGGHILLVKRKFAPGKGLWALPGGYINQTETARAACIRELKEETGLKVPTPVLDGSITFEKLFDKPDRSLRGRTITQAFLIELNGGDAKLPKVKGSDDAMDAKWIPIDEIDRMSDELFEDHYSIITTMLGRAK